MIHLDLRIECLSWELITVKIQTWINPVDLKRETPCYSLHLVFVNLQTSKVTKDYPSIVNTDKLQAAYIPISTREFSQFDMNE